MKQLENCVPTISTKNLWLSRSLILAFALVFNLAPTKANITDSASGKLSNLPFIANQGQIADESVLFHAKTFAGNAFIKDNGTIVYSIVEQTTAKEGVSGIKKVISFTETLLGTHAVRPVGIDPTVSRVNFLQGKTAVSDLPTYGAVKLPEIYAGIDLQITARLNNIEKIFTIAPGASPALIQMRLDGVKDLTVNSAGELVAQTALGAVRFTKPIAWQDTAGSESQRQMIDIAYVVENSAFSFRLGAYNPELPLMIDPLLAGTFVGGSGTDAITGITRDSEGNVYVAGYTDSSLDFPAAPGAITEYQGGLYDAFVLKFDPDLKNLLAATFFGGSGADKALAIAFNPDNACLYVGGKTDSTDFTGGAANNGATDGFVARFDTSLQNPETRLYGGPGDDSVNTLHIRDNKIYVAGETASSSFNLVNLGGLQPPIQGALKGQTNAFAGVLHPNFNMQESGATYLGGNGADRATALSSDTDGALVLVGHTSSTNFPATNSLGAIPQNKLSGLADAFVVKISSDLNSLLLSTYLGGKSNDFATAVTVDFSNRIYVAGATSSTNFPTQVSSYRRTLSGQSDMFITRLSPLGTSFEASTYFGGNNQEAAQAIAVIGDTNQLDVLVLGSTLSTNLPVTANAYGPKHKGQTDAFIARLDSSLTTNSVRLTTYLGGSNDDIPAAMLMDTQSESIYVAGTTASSDLAVPGFAFQPQSAGGPSDGFILKLGLALRYGGLKWKYILDDPDPENVFGLPTMGWDGTIYVAGGNKLYAFNPDGTKKWANPATPDTGYYFTHAEGGTSDGMGSTPTIDTDGYIYVGATGDGTTPHLYSFNPDGTRRWKRAFQGAGWLMLTAPLVTTNGLVYVGAVNNTYVEIINAHDGSPYGLISGLRGSVQNSPALGANGTVYVQTYHSVEGNTLYAIKDKNVVWDYNFASDTDGGRASLALDEDGLIYVSAGSNIYAVADTGTAGVVERSWSTAGTIYSSPAIGTNGMLYIGNGNRLYCFDSKVSGSNRWERPVVGSITSSPALAANGDIYVGGSIHLYSFSATGQTNWQFEVDEEISFHSPLIATDGTVYMTDFFTLYAVYGESPANLDAPWPAFRRDVLRTGNAGLDLKRYAAPTGLTASKGTLPDRTALSWNPIQNVLYYELWRSTSPHVGTADLYQRLTQTTFEDSDITPGQVYYYWLRASTPVVPLSDYNDGDFGGAPPRPPQNVLATKGIPAEYVEVTWEHSSFAETYKLYCSTVDDLDTAELIASLGLNFSYDDYGVTNFPGRTHYYWFTAANQLGWTSAFSPGDGVANAGGIPPRTPLGLTADKGLTSTNVGLSWTAADYDVTDYIIYRHTETNVLEATVIATNGTETAYSDKGSTPFRPYYYWVRSHNQYGYSDYSVADAGWTVLLPPLEITATIDRTNRVVVSWVIESTNATSYRIYRSDTADPNQSTEIANLLYPGDGTTFEDFSISLGSEYYYFAKACNAYGESAYSDPSNLGGTFPLPPTNLRADATTNNTILLTWNPSLSPGTRGYQIYRAETFLPDQALLIGATEGASDFDDANCALGQRYYYWAVATNRLGSSKFSGLNSGWLPLPPPVAISATSGTSTNHVTVSWSEVQNATRYEIWRNTGNDPHTAEKLQNDWPSTTYNDTEVTAGTMQYYWVKAKSTEFISEFSPMATGFRAQGPVDLAALVLSCTPNVLVPGSSPKTMSLQLANLGPNNMAGANSRIRASLFLSPSATFAPETAYSMGELEFNLHMPAGSTRTYILQPAELNQFTAPFIPSGTYYLFLYADHALPSTWHDPNPANNVVQRPAKIQIQPLGGGQQLINDYDGDGISDPAVYRASDGRWRVWMSGSGYAEITAAGLGGPGFVPVPADYDGDGKTDPAVYRASDGRWRVWMSGSGYAEITAAGMGGSNYIPVPGDYDGDGKTDPAVYRASDGRWKLWYSDSAYLETSYLRGGAGFLPVPGAYDYDTKTDPAVFAADTGDWTIWLSSYGYPEHNVYDWGIADMIAIPGDYNGNGLTDLALYHTKMGYWFINNLDEERIVWGALWGGVDFIPVPGDYDGDGMADLAVYHIPTGSWYVQTAAGKLLAYDVRLGGPDYVPAAGCFN